MPKFNEAIFGQSGKTGSSFTKEQQGGINDILKLLQGMVGSQGDITQNQGYQTGMGALMNLFNDEGFFKQLAGPMMRQYEEQIVPDTANRFAAMGSGGALGSTGFRNQMAREGSNLATNLAALQGGMQMQAAPQLMQGANMPFQNLSQLYSLATGQGMNNVYRPATSGLSGMFAEGAGKAFGQSFGGGA